MQEIKSFPFDNKYYHDGWMEFVPGTEDKVRYRDGTYSLAGDGSKVVYDGSAGLMGWVRPDGTMISNYPGSDMDPDNYEMTFLRAAAEV